MVNLLRVLGYKRGREASDANRVRSMVPGVKSHLHHPLAVLILRTQAHAVTTTILHHADVRR